MDVHGTKLTRTLFTIATGVEPVPPNKGMELTVKSDTPFAKKSKGRAAFACSSSQALGSRNDLLHKIPTSLQPMN